MADKEVKVKFNIDTANSAKSLKDTKQAIKDLKSAALEVGEGGKGFTELTKKAAQLQEKLDDVTDSTKIQGSNIEKLKTSMGLLTEGFKNADPGKLSIAMKGLGSAMKAIPLILIIEGITYLIENFESLSKGTGLLGKTLRIVGDIIQWVTDKIYEFTDAIGLTNSALDKQGEALITNAEKAKTALDTQTKGYDNQIAAAQAAGKSSVKFEIAKQEAIIQTNKALVEQTIAYVRAGGKLTEEQQKLVTDQINAIKDAKAQEVIIKAKADKLSADNYKKNLEEKKKTDKEAYDAYVLALQKSIDSTREAGQTIQDIEKADAKKIQDAKNKADDEEYAKLLAQFQETKAFRKRITDQRIQDIKDENDKILANTQLTEDEKKELISKNEDSINKIRQEGLNKSLAGIQQYANSIASALNSVVGVFQAIAELQQQQRNQQLLEQQRATDAQIAGLDAQKEYELSKEGLTAQQKLDIENKYKQQKYQLELLQYNRETEVKKKAFEQDKKLKIATTIISTITGSIAALTGMIQAIPGPVGIILGAISAAAVVAIGAINIAKIKQQKFDAGTPPAPPSISAPSTSGIDSQNGPNTFPTPRRDAELNRVGSGANNQSNQPQKVYVVSQEVEESNNKAALIEERSKFK